MRARRPCCGATQSGARFLNVRWRTFARRFVPTTREVNSFARIRLSPGFYRQPKSGKSNRAFAETLEAWPADKESQIANAFHRVCPTAQKCAERRRNFFSVKCFSILKLRAGLSFPC